MKFRNTVQLGALLVFLVIAYFGWQALQEQSDAIAQQEKRVFAFAPEDIREVTVHRLDELPTTGVRGEGGQWTITEPHPSIKPNHELWNRIAENAAELMMVRALPEDATAYDAYGLDVPRLTVGLEANGEAHTLRFGYLEPTQTSRYARLDTGPVFLVDKDAVFELDRPLDLLRDAYIVDNHMEPVLRFEYVPIMTAARLEAQLEHLDNPPPVGTEADKPVILERSGPDAPWQQLSPVHAPANQDKVNEIVQEIQHARGRNYVVDPESLADYGLDPANTRINLENGPDGGGRQSFFFGDLSTSGEDGGIWVRKEGEPSVFIIDGHIATLFPRSLQAFRERRLLTRPVEKLARIEVSRSEQPFTLARDEDGHWQVTQPALDDTDSEYVTQYISALKSLEGLQFLDGAPADYGLDAPALRLRFQLTGDGEPAEVLLAPNPEDPEQYYARNDLGELMALPAGHIQFLLGSPQQFRLMNLLRFPVNGAQRMRFEMDGVEYALEKVHNRWLVTAPDDRFMPNQADATALLDAVARLRAVGAEAEVQAEPAAYGFEAPRFSFTVTLAPVEAGGAEETLGPLVVGGVVPGVETQRFAQSASRPGVFRIPQAFLEQVSASVAGIRPKGGGGAAGN